MYQLDHDISFEHEGKKFQLALLISVTIEKSVELLSDTATIVLPESVLNRVLDIRSKIGRGATVSIRLGYNGDLRDEFNGYIEDIKENDSSLIIKCEDALFLFRNAVPDVELKPTSVAKIAQYLIDHIDPEFQLSCDYDLGYEKFVIHQATAYDVLKKLLEETKANIYFDTLSKTLHVHPPFVEKTGEVKYSMQRNIEKSSLEYKRAEERKAEVTVESIDSKGNVTSIKRGSTGGDKITLKVGSMSKSDMIKVAESELFRRSSDAYEGTIDTWLIPFVEPTYTAELKDSDYPDKMGRYYIPKVVTSFSQSGGVRTVSVGLKLN